MTSLTELAARISAGAKALEKSQKPSGAPFDPDHEEARQSLLDNVDALKLSLLEPAELLFIVSSEV